MNPYEKTAEEMKRQSQGPQRFAKAAIGVGTALGAASFAPILARAAPLLSQYIPEALAIKGLSKISPKFGKFIKESLDDGYDFSEVKDFIGDQITQSQSSQAKDNRNVIEQYSPELHQFLSQRVKGGEDPIKAAALALFEKGNPFEQTIRKIEKDHKTNWSQLVQSVYANNNPSQMGQTQQQMQQDPQLQMQGQQQPQGQGMQAVMSILQKINQGLGQ